MTVWFEAARPKTLLAAVSPVIIGIAIAFSHGALHPLSATLAMLGALLIQVGTNFYNDLADFEMGADTYDRIGPRRLVQAGLISPPAMRTATVVTFGIAILSGVYLMLRGGWPVVIIGFSSILFGLLYTGSRFSLAYLGIADLFVLLFFGPVAVAGTYYVQALTWPVEVWIAGIAPGFLAVSILMVNNIRDYHQDRKAGKKTIVVRLGRPFGVRAYFMCQLAPLFIVLQLWLFCGSSDWIMLSFLAVPFFWQTWRRLREIPPENASELNRVLGRTARNLLVFSLLFSAGWLLGAM